MTQSLVKLLKGNWNRKMWASHIENVLQRKKEVEGLTVVLWVGWIRESIRLWVSNADSLCVGAQWHCCLFLKTHVRARTQNQSYKYSEIMKGVNRSNKQHTLTMYQTAGPQSIKRNNPVRWEGISRCQQNIWQLTHSTKHRWLFAGKTFNFCQLHTNSKHTRPFHTGWHIWWSV